MAAEAGEEQAILVKGQLEEAREYETTKRPVEDKLATVCKDEHEESICEPAASRGGDQAKDSISKKDEMEESDIKYKELEATVRVALQDEETTSEERLLINTEIVLQDDEIYKKTKDANKLIQIYKDQTGEVREQYEETKVRANEKLEGTSRDEHDDADALSTTEVLDRENAQDSASGKIKGHAEEISSEFNLDPGLVKGEMEGDCFNQKELEAAEQVAICEQESMPDEKVSNNIEKVCQDDRIDKKTEENTKLLHEHKDQTEEAAQEAKDAADIDNKKLESGFQDEYKETELLLPVEKADDMNKYSEPKVSGKENAQDSATVNIEEHKVQTTSYYNSDPGEMKDETEGGHKDSEATGQVQLHDKDGTFEEKELMDREVSKYEEMHEKTEEIAEPNHEHKDQFDEVAQNVKTIKPADEEKLAGLCKDENKESITEILPSGEGAQGNDGDESSEAQILKRDIEQEFFNENNEGDIKQTTSVCNLDTDPMKDKPKSEYEEFKATGQAPKYDTESIPEERELTNAEEVTQDDEMDKKTKETTALMQEHKDPLEEVAENDEATEHEDVEKLASPLKDEDKESIRECTPSGDGDQGIPVDEPSEEKVSENEIEQESFTAHIESDVDKTTCKCNLDTDQIKEEIEGEKKELEEAGQIPKLNEANQLSEKELTIAEDVSHEDEMYKKTEVIVEHMHEHKDPLEKVAENDEATEQEDVEKLASPSKDEDKETIRECIPSGEGDYDILVDEPSEEKVLENEIEQESFTAHIESDVEKTTCKCNVDADQIKEEIEGEQKKIDEAGQIPKHNEASQLSERELTIAEDVSHEEEMYKAEVTVEHMHEKDQLEEVAENDEATEHEDVEKLASPSKDEDKETITECIPSGDGDQGILVVEQSEEKVLENEIEQESFTAHIESDIEKTTCKCNVDADQIKEEIEGEQKELEEAGQIPNLNEASQLNEKELTIAEDVSHEDEMYKKTELTVENIHKQMDPLEEVAENDEATEHEDVKKLASPSKDEDKESIRECIPSGDGDQGIPVDEPSEEKVSENEIEQESFTAHIESDVEKTTCKCNVDADKIKEEIEGEQKEIDEAGQIPKHNEASQLSERELTIAEDVSHEEEMYKAEVTIKHMHEQKDQLEEVAENDEATEHEDVEKLASPSKDEDKETITECIPSGDGDQGILVDEQSEEKVLENEIEQESFTAHIESDIEKTTCKCNVDADQIKEEIEGDQKELEEAGQIPKLNEASQLKERELIIAEDVSHEDEMYKKSELTVENIHKQMDPLEEVAENDEATEHEDVEKLASPSKDEDKETINECIPSGNGDQGIQVDEPSEEKVSENEIEQESFTAHIESDVEKTTCKCNADADQIKEEIEGEQKELEEAGQIPKHIEASPPGERELTNIEDVYHDDEMYKRTEVNVEHMHEHKEHHEEVAEDDEASQHVHDEKLVSFCKDEEKATSSEPIPYGGGDQGKDVDESSETKDSERTIEEEPAADHVEGQIEQTTSKCNLVANQMDAYTECVYKETEETGQVPTHDDDSTLEQKEFIDIVENCQDNEMYKKTEETAKMMHGHKDQLEEVAENDEAVKHADDEKLANPYKDEDEETVSEHIPSVDGDQDNQVDESSEARVSEKENELDLLSANVKRHIEQMTSECNLETDGMEDKTGQNKEFEATGQVPTHDEESNISESELTNTGGISEDEIYRNNQLTAKFIDAHKEHHEEASQDLEPTKHEDDENLVSLCKDENKRCIVEPVPYGVDQGNDVKESSETKYSEKEIEQEFANAHLNGQIEQTTSKCKLDAGQTDETEGEYKEIEATGEVPTYDEEIRPEQELISKVEVSEDHEIYRKTEQESAELMHEYKDQIEVAEKDEATNHDDDQKVASLCRDGCKETLNEPIPSRGGDQGNDIHESSEVKVSDREIERGYTNANTEENIQQTINKCNLDDGQMKDETGGEYKDIETTRQVPTADEESTLEDEMYKKTEQTTELIDEHQKQIEIAEYDEDINQADKENLEKLCKDEDKESTSEPIPSTGGDQGGDANESSEARDSEKDTEQEFATTNIEDHIKQTDSKCNLDVSQIKDDTEGECKECEATAQIPTHNEEKAQEVREFNGIVEVSQDDKYKAEETAELTNEYKDKVEEIEGKKEADKGVNDKKLEDVCKDEPTEVDKLLQQSADVPESLCLEEVIQNDADAKHVDDEMPEILSKDEEKETISEFIPSGGGDHGNNVDESSDRKDSVEEMEQEFSAGNIQIIEQMTSDRNLDAGQLNDETGSECKECEATAQVSTHYADAGSTLELRELITTVELPQDDEMYKRSEEIFEVMHEKKYQLQEVVPNDEANKHVDEEMPASPCKDDHKETTSEPIPSGSGDQVNTVDESSEKKVSEEKIQEEFATSNIEVHIKQMTSESNLEAVVRKDEKEGENKELEATRQIPTNDDDNTFEKRESISIVEVPEDDEVCKTEEIDMPVHEQKDQLEQVPQNDEASKCIGNETLASLCKDGDKENISKPILSGGGDYSNDVDESSEETVSDEKVEKEFATANIEGQIQQTTSMSNLDAVKMKGEREGECEELEATVKVQTLDKESTLKERVLANEEVPQDDMYKTEETADIMYKHKDQLDKVANNDEALNQLNKEDLASPCKDDDKESITEPITSADEDQVDVKGSSEAKISQIEIEQVFPTVNDEGHIEQKASKCELDANQMKEEIEGKYSEFEAAGQVLIHGEETTHEERDLINKKEVSKDDVIYKNTDDTAELIHENKVQSQEAEQEYETSKHDEQLIIDFKEDHEETVSKPIQTSGGEQVNVVDGSIIEEVSEEETEKWSATLDIKDHFEQTTTVCKGNTDATQMEDDRENDQLENEKLQETENVAAVDQESTQEERVLIETEEVSEDDRYKKNAENNEDQYEEVVKDEASKPIEDRGQEIVCKNEHTETVSEATGRVAIHAEDLTSEERLSISTKEVPLEYEVHMKTEEASKPMLEDQNGVITNISMQAETTLQCFKEKRGENIGNLHIEHILVEEIGHPRGEVSSDVSSENIDHENLSGDSLSTNEEISIISTKQAYLKEDARNIAEEADEQIKEIDLSADYTIGESLGAIAKPNVQEKLESQSNMDSTSLDEQVYDAATVNSSQQQRGPAMYNNRECLDKLEISLDEIPENLLSVEEKALITKDSATDYPPDIQGTSKEEHEAISLSGTMGKQSSISSHEDEKYSKEGPIEFKVKALENKDLTTKIHDEATVIPEEEEEITEKQDNGILLYKETVSVSTAPDISVHPNTYSSEIKFENITEASETASNQPGHEETTEEGDITSLKMDGSASKDLVDINTSQIASEQSISSVVSEGHELNEDTMVIEEKSKARNLMTAATEFIVKGEHEAVDINKKMKDDEVLSGKNLEKISEVEMPSDQIIFTSKEDGLSRDEVSPKVSMEKSISETASEDNFHGLTEVSQVMQTNTSESKSRELLESFPEKNFQTISFQSEDMGIKKSQLIVDEPEESFTAGKVVGNEINEDQESERSLQLKDAEDVKQNKENNVKSEFGVTEIVITSECNLENIYEKDSTNNEMEASKFEDIDSGMDQDLVPHKQADAVVAIDRDHKDMEIINDISSESIQKNQEQADQDDLPVSRYLMERILQEEGEKIDKASSDDPDRRIQDKRISQRHNDYSIQEKDDCLDVSLVGLTIQDRSIKSDKADNQCFKDSLDSTKEERLDLQKADLATERVDQSPKIDNTESAPAKKSCLESALEIQEIKKPNDVEEEKDTASYFQNMTKGKNQETESLKKGIEVPSMVKSFEVDKLSEEAKTSLQELERDDKASHDVQHVKEPASYFEKMTKSKIQEEIESLNKENEFPQIIVAFEADTSLQGPITSLQELERDDKASQKVQHEKEPASLLENMTKSKIQEENESLNKDIEVPSINKTLKDDNLSQEGRTSLQEPDRDDKASHEVSEQTSLTSEAVGKPKSVCHVENPLNYLVDQSQMFDSDNITPGGTLNVPSEQVGNADQGGNQPELQSEQSISFISGDKVTEGTSNVGSGNDKMILLETQQENINNNEESQTLELDRVQQVALSAKSTEETIQVDKKILKEKDSKVGIHEEQTGEKKYYHIEEMKDRQENDDNEEDYENKDEGSTPDSAVMVEVKEADLKPTHKKSHNILSGVKHSLAKVKKAIIGKSSHSKTVSPR